MNEMKTYIKVVADIILEALVKEVLHFESPAAYDYFMKGSDTHKTYQILEVFVIGTLQEMMKLYVSNTTDLINVINFLQFEPSNTYRLIKQLILNYGLAIIVQKIGDRNNNIEVHEAGRYKFLEMFYGFQHPFYQEIEYRDLKVKASYPPEIKDVRNRNLTFSITSTQAKNQGGDFILEGKIKRASKGVDDEKMWKTVSRSLDDIIKISKRIYVKLHIHDTDGECAVSLSEEITSWRALLRESKYLKSFTDTDVIHNIYGESMSSSLTELPSRLKINMQKYWEEVESGMTPELSYISAKPGQDIEDLLYYDGIDL